MIPNVLLMYTFPVLYVDRFAVQAGFVLIDEGHSDPHPGQSLPT